MIYNIIASGSSGNCVTYHDNMVMVDMGVSFSAIKDHYKNVRILLISHVHCDHFNEKAIRLFAKQRPSLRIGCSAEIANILTGIRNIDIYEVGKTYDYGSIKIIPVQLYHNVPNFGFKIFKGDHKIFHATDTSHLEGIQATNYDLYAIEHNYDKERINDIIQELERRGEYSHQRESVNNHLSIQQAQDFYFKNRGENSEIIRLHESKTMF